MLLASSMKVRLYTKVTSVPSIPLTLRIMFGMPGSHGTMKQRRAASEDEDPAECIVYTLFWFLNPRPRNGKGPAPRTLHHHPDLALTPGAPVKTAMADGRKGSLEVSESQKFIMLPKRDMQIFGFPRGTRGPMAFQSATWPKHAQTITRPSECDRHPSKTAHCTYGLSAAIVFCWRKPLEGAGATTVRLFARSMRDQEGYKSRHQMGLSQHRGCPIFYPPKK